MTFDTAPTTTMHRPPLVTIEDVTVRFPIGRKRFLTAVDRVELRVEAGQTFGLIGESGSGKSTLGRMIICLNEPSEGRLLHGEVDPYRLRAKELRIHRRQYQAIFQDPSAALDPRMSVLKSVREPLDVLAREPVAERTALALEMLERVGLGAAYADRYPHQLSGGQKQRACIARVLTLRPSLIVCDEAIAALDVSIQADILNLLADLQVEFGLTYFFITHDIAVVEHIADVIAVMYLGSIVEIAPAERLSEGYCHPYTEALLSAEPVALPKHMRSDRRILLEGELPSPVNPPSGCRFRTRCRYATERCASEEPALRKLSPGHSVACHYAESFRKDGEPREVEKRS